MKWAIHEHTVKPSCHLLAHVLQLHVPILSEELKLVDFFANLIRNHIFHFLDFPSLVNLNGLAVAILIQLGEAYSNHVKFVFDFQL